MIDRVGVAKDPIARVDLTFGIFLSLILQGPVRLRIKRHNFLVLCLILQVSMESGVSASLWEGSGVPSLDQTFVIEVGPFGSH
jgi:hypothetical protein